METAYDTPSGAPSAPGEWKEGRYLALPTPHRFELADGRLEVLPIASWFDAFISEYVYERLKEYLKQNPVGRIVPSPIFVRLWHGQIRLPDLTLVFNSRLAADRKKAQDGADFVVEVVSGDGEDRRRDLVEKRAVYAKAGIAEYWIVDPETRTITVLALANNEYRETGKFSDGAQASSVLLQGFSVDVTQTFDAGEK